VPIAISEKEAWKISRLKPGSTGPAKVKSLFLAKSKGPDCFLGQAMNGWADEGW
jgi:hypothetical protein